MKKTEKAGKLSEQAMRDILEDKDLAPKQTTPPPAPQPPAPPSGPSAPPPIPPSPDVKPGQTPGTPMAPNTSTPSTPGSVNSTGPKRSIKSCIMLASPLTSRTGSRESNTLLWSGASPSPRRCKSAMTAALTGAACMKFITAVPAGAVPYRALTSCGNCAAIILSSGQSCWSWMKRH